MFVCECANIMHYLLRCTYFCKKKNQYKPSAECRENFSTYKSGQGLVGETRVWCPGWFEYFGLFDENLVIRAYIYICTDVISIIIIQAWCMLLNDKVPFRMQWPQYADLQVNGMLDLLKSAPFTFSSSTLSVIFFNNQIFFYTPPTNNTHTNNSIISAYRLV